MQEIEDKLSDIKRLVLDFTEIQTALAEVIPIIKQNDEYNVLMFLGCLEDHTRSFGCDYKTVFHVFELYKLAVQFNKIADINYSPKEFCEKVKRVIS